VVSALIFQGALWVFTIAISLVVIGIPRRKFAQQVEQLASQNPLAFIAPDLDKFRHSFQIKLPKCGVVMPVKGVHDQSYANWRAQITSMYGGPLEFFFCLESADDPAFRHVQRLIEDNPDVQINLLVAGLSWHCSQKIHNQIHGFERAMRSCEYVIVIDDDIKLHPGTIRAWVEEMETDPQVLAATGYAFEYVAPGEIGWPSFFAMLWRLCASTGFNSPTDRPPNAWGGAMMFRASELRANLYGLLDAWRDGGYSEGLHHPLHGKVSASLSRPCRVACGTRLHEVARGCMQPSHVMRGRFRSSWDASTPHAGTRDGRSRCPRRRCSQTKSAT